MITVRRENLGSDTLFGGAACTGGGVTVVDGGVCAGGVLRSVGAAMAGAASTVGGRGDEG